MSSKIKYRPEVDGLRSVAVIPVVLFHLGSGLIPGGFVGVDIFFVISGFLITSILAVEIEAGQFSLLTFYKRRALRILPALLFVVLGVSIMAFLILAPKDIRALGESLPYIATFTPNLYFADVTNYFAPDAATQPLLHTWSLGVEEQFYIAYPLMLVLVMGRFRKLLYPAIWAMGLVSFALCLWLVETGHFKAAFYMFPARAWEFALGALVALGGAPRVSKPIVRQALSILGVILILASMVMLSSAAIFPSWNAIPPALGAALVIAYAQGGWIGACLGSKLPRVIGKVSYSLYLWHWPVIVVAHHLVGDTLGGVEIVSCLIVMAALTAFSFHFVEKPFRGVRWSNSSSVYVLSVGAGGIVAVCVLGLAMRPLSAGALISQGAEARRLTAYLDYEKTPRSMADVRMEECFLTPDSAKGAKINQASCLDAPSARSRVLVFGDSHAAYMMPGLRAAFPEVSFLQATAAGCAPILNVGGEAGYCQRTLAAGAGAIKAQNYSAIVLAARWRPKDLEPLARTVRDLRASGQVVVVMGPIIEYSDALPTVLAREAVLPIAPIERFRRRERADLDARMRAAIEPTGGIYVSQQAAACLPSGCPVFAGDRIPVSFDYGHYTAEGAVLIQQAVRRAHPELLEVFTRPPVPGPR